MAKDEAIKANYLYGNTPEILEANRKYKEALDALNATLESRRSGVNQPMLGIAAGFLAPTKTGSGFEAIGRALEGYTKGREAQQAEEEAYAKQKLGLASAGIDLARLGQRQQQFDQMARQFGGGLPSRPVAPVAPVAPGAAPAPSGALAGGPSPAAPLGAPGATPAAPGQGALPTAQPDIRTALDPNRKPPGFENVKGVPFAPPDPAFQNLEGYIYRSIDDPKKSPADVHKEFVELAKKRYEKNEYGLIDHATGLLYPAPKAEAVTRQINGQTYTIPVQTAFELDRLYNNNDPKYWELADRILKGGPQRPTPSGALQSAAPTATGVAPSEPPPGAVSEEERIRRAKTSETESVDRAHSASKDETKLRERADSASEMSASANRVISFVQKSPQMFGILQKPAIMSAIAGAIQEGISTPGGGRIGFAGIEDAVRKMYPGAKQEDLDNALMAAGDLARVELIFTREFLSGEGAVTQGEREIVRRIGGSTSDPAGVILARMKLINQRSEFNTNMRDAWESYNEKYPNKSFYDFKRSKEAKAIKADYDRKLGVEFQDILGGKSSGKSGGKPLTNEQASEQLLRELNK